MSPSINSSSSADSTLLRRSAHLRWSAVIAPWIMERAGPITSGHKKMLVNFMEAHPGLKSGRFTPNFKKATAKQFWQQAAIAVNSVPRGSLKDWEQVRRYWQDMKKVVKGKVAEQRRHAIGTGGGEVSQVNLTPVEEQVLDSIPAFMQTVSCANRHSTIYTYITVTMGNAVGWNVLCKRKNLYKQYCY